MEALKAAYRFLTKYLTRVQLLIIAALLAFAFIFSESNLFTRWKHDAEIHELKGQIKHYRKQAQTDTEKLEELEADKDQIEKFARENYLMKKANEDIYIVE